MLFKILHVDTYRNCVISISERIKNRKATFLSKSAISKRGVLYKKVNWICGEISVHKL